MTTPLNQFDWKILLSNHEIFSDLSEQEIETLLEDEISQTRKYCGGEVIIREGERSDVVFLMGLGVAQVFLGQKVDPLQIEVATLHKGDLFGEMALIKKTRAATVKAKEECILLEINGNAVRKLIEKHPNIGFKILFLFSERLRNIDNQLSMQKLADADDRLELYDKKFRESLTSTYAIFDEAKSLYDRTNSRTHELIINAEESRKLIRIFGSVIAVTITIAGGIFGWLGFKGIESFYAIQEARDNLQEIPNLTEQYKSLIELEESFAFFQFKNILYKIHAKNQSEEVKQNQEMAISIYGILRETNKDYVERLLDEIEIAIYNHPEHDYTNFIWRIVENRQRSEDISSQDFKEIVRGYYLLLSNALLIDKKAFMDSKEARYITLEEIMYDFQEFAEASKIKGLNKNELTLKEKFEKFKESDPEKYNSFERIVQLTTN